MAYRSRTSPLFPLPPALYSALPMWFKRVFLMELAMYETDWSYCGEDAKSTLMPAVVVNYGSKHAHEESDVVHVNAGSASPS